MNIDRQELLRYLGWRGQNLDQRTEDALGRMSELCLAVATPRHTLKKFAYKDGILTEVGLKLLGNDIIKHLEGAEEIYLFAATIGINVERELEKLYIKSHSDALIFDAAASACIESYVEECCAELEKESGKHLLPRFSCGYGDFPISMQNDICALLSTDSRIGLCADERHTLSPLKSVTAVIGILSEGAGADACANRCAICTKENCVYRK